MQQRHAIIIGLGLCIVGFGLFVSIIFRHETNLKTAHFSAALQTSSTEVVLAQDDNSSAESSGASPFLIIAALGVGFVLGSGATWLFMRRQIPKTTTAQAQPKSKPTAQKPTSSASTAKKPRPSVDLPHSSPRSIAAAKRIGGQTLLKTGQATEAYLMFLDAIEQDEDDAEAWLWAGLAAMKMKKYDVAQQTLLQARLLGNERAEDALRKLKDLIDRQAEEQAVMDEFPSMESFTGGFADGDDEFPDIVIGDNS